MSKEMCNYFLAAARDYSQRSAGQCLRRLSGLRDLFDFPRRSVPIEIFRGDAEEGFGLANGPLVSHSLQTHGQLLSQVVVVFKPETLVLFVQNSGGFHAHARVEVARAERQALARWLPSITCSCVKQMATPSRAVSDAL